MFTIQYANGCKIWDVVPRKLNEYILTSEHDISAVFEQATPVTKRVRRELVEAFNRGVLKNATPAARRFMHSDT